MPWLRVTVLALVLVGLACVPLLAVLTGQSYYMTLFGRIVILAIAAVSLNLILGYGGMVSFGHAAYLGVGAYAVGILASHDITSGYVQWPVAVLAAALLALVVGALSLRTRGVYFIMITLAFAQMVYFVAVGLEDYGGDDGLTIYSRSDFGSWLPLSDNVTFYYVCFAVLLLSLLLVRRITNSRFGYVIRGAAVNDRRMRSLGFATYPYRLTCFVIAGALAGLAGALLANHTDFVSPAMMHWTRSGDLIVIVILGGLGSLLGPVLGALAFLAAEELLSGLTSYWQMIFGPLLLVLVLFAPGGIHGLLAGEHVGSADS
ncbi:MAG: branched-chain amino acid ABC transporter permease [Pseudomonadota bacterium]|nr:branched-chain amino acid ABC transporter permease [Pseudomonadota bacterium]